MRVNLVVAVIWGLALQSYASQWQWTVPSQKSIPIEILGISMIDSLQGWIVGNNEQGGHIYRTSNGWVTWEERKVKLVPGVWYRDVAFADSLHGWIVGKNGLIMHTSNGGINWQIQAVNLTSNDIRKLSVINSKTAYACGGRGTILYTIDGQNWKSAEISQKYTNDLLGIAMFDAKHGIAVGRNGAILYTRDGIHWHGAANPPRVEWRDFTSVAMADSNSAWLVGSFKFESHIQWVLAKTQDGGNSWQLYLPPDSSCVGLSAIKFVNSSTGIAVGARGCVFITHDNENWTRLDQHFGNDGLTLAVLGTKIWIAGRGGTIAHSPDFGSSWSILPSMTSNFLYKIRAIDNDHIAAIGYASILQYSEDSGINWKAIAVVADNQSSTQLWGIDFLNRQTGWVVGTDGFIAKTGDGCRSWERQGKGLVKDWLRDVWAYDENNLWIVGDAGLIMNSRDGGATWNWDRIDSTFKDLFDIEGFNKSEIVAVGSNSTFIYTRDAGTTWHFAIKKNLTNNVRINSVHLIDKTHAWAVGESGTVMFSNDSGATWEKQPFPSFLCLEGVHFKDVNTGYIVGENGTIFETTNGGQTWIPVAQGITDRYLKSIDITSDGKILICGYYGVIVRYGPLPSPQFVERKIHDPLNFALGPNYPNPFNEQTILRYQLPVRSTVQLSVYNLMGQLVQTLVDEEQAAGSYSVEWRAPGLSSGVYLFKLTTPQFVSIHKGTLLK